MLPEIQSNGYLSSTSVEFEWCFTIFTRVPSSERKNLTKYLRARVRMALFKSESDEDLVKRVLHIWSQEKTRRNRQKINEL